MDRQERLEGETLDGRFFIRQHLGAGAFGAVYLAEQRVFGLPLRQVAIKLFHGTVVTPKNAATVLNDAVVLMQLQQEPSHAEAASHLVTVFDAGFLRDRPDRAFVAMEYVEGYRTPGGGVIRTFDKFIEAFQPVPVELALRWMIQILRPLAWMHTLPHPVLHCDLKPENILVRGRDSLKVADFGLAQLAFGGIGARTAGGTTSYLAPEALLGVLATPATDVYSLGLIFYEILAGKNPFAEAGTEALLAGRTEEYVQRQLEARSAALPRLSALDHPELKRHPVLEEIIGRCLRVRASERYDSAAALLRAVERYASGKGVELIPTGACEKTGPATVPTLEHFRAEAQALVGQGRLAEARQRCEEARAAFPKSGKPYRQLAEICLAGGDWRAALKICAQGRAVDGDEPELFEALAHAYEMGGQPSVATRMREEAAALRKRGR